MAAADNPVPRSIKAKRIKAVISALNFTIAFS